ncbi:MAG: VanZ family protein [Ruminiclostridium sp.]|nr:VanZ family protein [Ruminiclostridium sp.]
MKISFRRKSVIILLVGYSLLLAYWMIWGFGRMPHSGYMYNLTPFSTIKHFIQIDKFNTETWIINLIGNIGVFVPFGILIPLVFRTRLLKTLIIALLGLFILETTQLITTKGSFDVDGFILNISGVIVGYVILIIFKMLIKSRSGDII